MKVMNLLYKISYILNKILSIFAGLFLVAMILLTSSNIVLRQFGMPISGTFELMGLMGAVVAALAMGYSHEEKEHLFVDILVNKFPQKIKQILAVISSLLCMLFFAIATWQLIKKALILASSGEVTETLGIIYYPFTYGVAIGCGALGLSLFVEFFKSVVILVGGKKI